MGIHPSTLSAWEERYHDPLWRQSLTDFPGDARVDVPGAPEPLPLGFRLDLEAVCHCVARGLDYRDPVAVKASTRWKRAALNGDAIARSDGVDPPLQAVGSVEGLLVRLWSIIDMRQEKHRIVPDISMIQRFWAVRHLSTNQSTERQHQRRSTGIPVAGTSFDAYQVYEHYDAVVPPAHGVLLMGNAGRGSLHKSGHLPELLEFGDKRTVCLLKVANLFGKPPLECFA